MIHRWTIDALPHVLTELEQAETALTMVAASDVSDDELLPYVERYNRFAALAQRIERELTDTIEPPHRSVRAIRREQFKLANGFKATDSFADALSDVHYRMSVEAYRRAEVDTCGQMIARRYRDMDVDPEMFWHLGDRYVRKYASDEMKDWFDRNGRVTKADLRRMVVDGEQTVRGMMLV